MFLASVLLNALLCYSVIVLVIILYPPPLSLSIDGVWSQVSLYQFESSLSSPHL